MNQSLTFQGVTEETSPSMLRRTLVLLKARFVPADVLAKMSVPGGNAASHGYFASDNELKDRRAFFSCNKFRVCKWFSEFDATNIRCDLFVACLSTPSVSQFVPCRAGSFAHLGGLRR